MRIYLVNTSINIACFLLILWLNWNVYGGDLIIWVEYISVSILHLVICVGITGKIGNFFIAVMLSVLFAFLIMKSIQSHRNAAAGSREIISVPLDSLNR